MRNLILTLIKTVAVVVTGMTTAALMVFILFLIFVGIGVGLVGVDVASTGAPKYSYHYGDELSNNVLLSIPITGIILGDKTIEDEWTALFASSGVTYGYEVKEILLKAAAEDTVSAVVLEIDSPGGTIYGSAAISDGVAAYREQTGKPVFAYIAGMAASGGYWAAASADTILADVGTGIGSIGVISGPFKYYDRVISEDGGAFLGGVVTIGGVQTQYFTAGEHKDMGNPYRQLSVKETATLQEMVNDSYAQFVSYVAERRGLDTAMVRNQIQALLYGNEQAERLQLIDRTASKQEAYALLATAAAVKEYQVKRPQLESRFFGSLLGAVAQPSASKVAGVRCPLSSHVLAYHGDLYSLCR
jgi:protease-4